MSTTHTRGYEVNLRQDKRTGEYLAVAPSSYRTRDGERYYIALTFMDGWCELSPEYLTRHTRTVDDGSESLTALKRAYDRRSGYIMHTVPRLLG